MSEACRLCLSVTFIFFICLCCNECPAQKYNISKFTTEDGLAGAEITSVIQDNKGYLWIGMYGGGIARFDGLQFKNYTISDGLADNRVLCLFLDSRNRLWIGTYGGGISCFDGKKFTNYAKKEGLSNNIVYGFAEDDRKNIWMATYGGGIDIYDGRTFTNISTDQKLASNNVWCLMKDRAGNIWAGTEGGISKIAQDRSITDFSKESGLDCAQAWSLMEDSKGNIWAGTYGCGAFCFDGKKFIQQEMLKGADQKIIYTICEDNSGNIWMGSDAGGVFVVEDKKVTTISEKNGLSHNRVRCILKDNEGIMWIGTDGGLSRYTGNFFTQYSVQEGLSDKKIISVLEDRNKNLWIGTFSGGLNKLSFSKDKPDEIEKIERFSINNGLSGERVWRLMEDSKGRLWIGTNNGITVYDGKSFKKYNSADGLPNNMIYAIFESADGKIWIGSDGGISVFDEKTFTNYSVKDGLTHNRVRSIIQDKNKIIWIGTYAGGVTYYQDGKFNALTGEKKLEHAIVYSIVADHENNIWFATFGDGIVCLKATKPGFGKKEFVLFTQKDGLGTNSVMSLNIDKKNMLWAGTIVGIDAIDLNKFLKNGKKEITHFGKEEGFSGIECHQNAVFTDAENRTWFGTINGAVRYNPLVNIYEGKEPQTYITEVKLFYGAANIDIYTKQTDLQTGLPQQLILPYDENHLTFEFSGLSFLNPRKVRYTFKLENFDSDWSPPSFKNAATYSNLPPGEYTFLVKASNGQGQWNKVPVKFSFIIESPYWKKTWFIVLIIITGIALIGLVIKLRTYKITHDNKVLDKRVKEQTTELTKQNHEKEILLKEIHHRVKNNLQMVSSLLNLQAITINDEKALAALQECRNRVNSMAVVHARLYRTENLSEIGFQSYTEQLYELVSSSYSLPGKKIESRISAENIFFNIDVIIPLGLILNELISNSFKHAFVNKEQGTILIELKKTSSGKHRFIYSDNGIGTDIKTAVKQNSMGMMLLQLLGDQLEGKYNFESNGGFRYTIEF